MPKSERPLSVDIPRSDADQPAWSRVGVVALVGFAIGMAWPPLLGKKIGPAVPGDLKAQVEASASAAAPPPPKSATAAPSNAPSATASAEADAPPAANQELVVVGAGRIVKCSDKSEKREKKVDDCEKLLFDPVAVKRLRELSKCPSALGLDGKMNIGFEVNFEKKEVTVKRVKKGTNLPSSTVSGIITCATQQFASAPLDDVPHKHRRYTLEYGLTFYGPGKHPDAVPSSDAPGGDPDAAPAAGATTNEAEANGAAVVAWDTALLRKEPKDGEVVARLVRGTKVKIVGKQSDWYKIESGAKSGWVYRGTIGL